MKEINWKEWNVADLRTDYRPFQHSVQISVDLRHRGCKLTIVEAHTGTTQMARAVAYNSIGTKSSRIVATFDVANLDEAVRIASAWNRDESRRNMQVNFVGIGGAIRPLAIVSAPLFEQVAS